MLKVGDGIVIPKKLSDVYNQGCMRNHILSCPISNNTIETCDMWHSAYTKEHFVVTAHWFDIANIQGTLPKDF